MGNENDEYDDLEAETDDEDATDDDLFAENDDLEVDPNEDDDGSGSLRA